MHVVARRRQVVEPRALLLERGLVERDTHGGDRRRSVLALSHAGHRIYDEIAPLALDLERRLLSRLDRDERDALDALLDKLAGGITHLADAPP